MSQKIKSARRKSLSAASEKATRVIHAMDNGVTGSMATLFPDGTMVYQKNPTRKTRENRKHPKEINRLNYDVLLDYLRSLPKDVPLLIATERPATTKNMISSISGARFSEALTLVTEQLMKERDGVRVRVVDSGEWQKPMLPSGLTGEAKKAASLALGKTMYPDIKFPAKKGTDADAIIMAVWAKNTNLK